MARDDIAALAKPVPPKPADILKGWFRSGEGDEEVLFLVAEADSAPVGFLMVVTCGSKAVIADFAVTTPGPEVGEQLLAEARLRLAARGVFRIRAALPD